MAAKVSESPPVTKRLRPMASLREMENEKSKAEKASKEGRIKRTRHACVYCQHLKMRCSGPTEEGPCERCRRSGHECLVEERSPHRPWTKRKDAQIQQLTERLEEMENLLRLNSQSNASYNSAPPIEESIQQPFGVPSTSYDPAQSILNGTQNGTGSVLPGHSNGVPNEVTSYTAEDSTDLGFPIRGPGSLEVPPSNMYSSKSIDHVLGHLEASSVSPSSASMSRDLRFIQDNLKRLPFVSTFRLTPEEAIDLFHIFMNSCAMHTVILDPEWHTVERVGSSSPFLFAVVVYIGSTFHRTRRTVRKELEEEMDALIGRIITSGHKSVEIVQGFLLLYQWNLPADDPANDRAWLLAGIGIRLATELQLYKSQKRSGVTTNASTEEADFERINQERCWLMTFCVDRSLSMAAGRPWSMSENVRLVRDSDEWYGGAQTRSWDLGISALVSLMKLVSRQTDILNTSFFKSDKTEDRGDSNGRDEDFDCDSMMRIMNGELEHWRRQWYTRGFFTSPVERKDSSIVAESPDNASPATSSSVDTNTLDIHTKTLHYVTKQASLRYNFAVLVLNSFGLQYCAEKPSMIHTRTSCTARAIQAGQSLVKAAREGMGKSMTYSPHTQYSIFGFGIISLIKLAPLVVDKVVCERIVNIVQTCITFLESVALTSDHTPARLASLSRAMLRKYEERKSVANGGKRKHDDDNSRRNNKKVKGSAGGTKMVKEDQSETQGQHEDENEGTQFAPDLDSFKLPQRSSRMVTPERGHVFANEDDPNAAQILSSLGSNSHINSIGSNGQTQPFSDPDMIPSNYLANAETDSLFQGLGLFETIDYSSYPQMTVEQILDSNFWLPISEG